MSLKVYDYRSDIVNMLVTPQIRCRFLKMAVGQFNAGHTHDLGQEIFLILQGRAAFEIDGESAELGPGQMCIAVTADHFLFGVAAPAIPRWTPSEVDSIRSACLPSGGRQR